MNKSQTFVVDFIVKGKTPDEMKMVLVEEGEWPYPIEDRLREIQHRMYGCIDAAIDGQLAEMFPETKNKKIVVSVDFYDAPKKEVSEFFNRFSANVLLMPSYRNALAQSKFVSDISFEASYETLAK